MSFFTKKKVVLFLLFIFPLICFLMLSTGQNNFNKLPVLTKNVLDISDITDSKSITFKGHVTVVCFLGDDIEKSQARLLNLNEKIYKKFIDFKQFQVIVIYPSEKEQTVALLKKKISTYTDMKNWFFTPSNKENIQTLFHSFNTNKDLENFGYSNAFMIDKSGQLRGRTNDKDTQNGNLFGYNMNKISVLKDKLKDDLNVLYYEYYAAFKHKNKNKADRKEVGL